MSQKRLMCMVLTLLLFFAYTGVDAARYNGISLSHSGYDYAPSVMYGDGLNIKMWWGGDTGAGDGIYYSTLSTSGWSSPQLVLRKSSSGWDSFHVCDPSVIKGNFTCNGTAYTYAMYYTATYDNLTFGCDNNIGVAFSNNGINWVKYGSPVVSPAGNAKQQYGAGMQTVYNQNGTIIMVYYDTTLGGNYMVTSSDGIHFSGRTRLNQPSASEIIGDIAYSPSDSRWFITTKALNDQAFYIYESTTSSLLSSWIQKDRVSSLTTGNYLNHNPGWMRLSNGNLYTEAVTGYHYIYFGTGSSSSSTWDIGQVIYQSNSWNFNQQGNRDGWVTANVTNDNGPDAYGNWVVTLDKVDPIFTSPKLEANAAVNHYVEITVANQTNRTDGRIYFKTEAENYFDESKSVSFTCSNGGVWFTHKIDMSVNPKWTGTITGIRIDPVSAGNGAILGITYIGLTN